MVTPSYTYKARCIGVKDGDTVAFNVDLGHHMSRQDVDYRFFGIDTPELTSKVASTKERAIKARAFVEKAILGKDVVIESIKSKLDPTKADSFGRYLAVIYYTNDKGEQVNLNEELLALGLAKVFKG